jgi:hemerythrin
MQEQVWGWSDRLALQFEPMDATHREFVDLCAALKLGTADDFVSRLDALIAHSVAHFEQENEWMRRFQFPPEGCHVQEHETVLEVMREVRKRIVAGETDLGPRLAEELPHWFEHHVDTMDTMLSRFLSSIGYQGEGVATPAQAVPV